MEEEGSEIILNGVERVLEVNINVDDVHIRHLRCTMGAWCEASRESRGVEK